MLLLQPLDLDQRLVLGLLRHAGGFDLLAQLARDRGLRTALAELLLDGTQLLAQEVLALLLVHPGLGFGLDLLAQVEHVQPLLDHDAQASQSWHRIEDFQQLLPLIGRELGREGDQVGQPARFFDPAHHRQHFFRHVGQHADVALDLLHDRGHGRFRLGRGIDRIVMPDDACDEIRLLLDELGDDATSEALQHDVATPAGTELRDLGDDADAAQLVLLRLRFRIGNPLWLAVDVGLNGLGNGVGQQRSQLPVVRGAIGRVRAELGWNRAFRQDEHEPVIAAGGTLDDACRLLILDRKRNRHVREQERLVDDEYRQQHGRRFATRRLLGASPASRPRLRGG